MEPHQHILPFLSISAIPLRKVQTGLCFALAACVFELYGNNVCIVYRYSSCINDHDHLGLQTTFMCVALGSILCRSLVQLHMACVACCILVCASQPSHLLEIRWLVHLALHCTNEAQLDRIMQLSAVCTSGAIFLQKAIVLQVRRNSTLL